MSATPRAALPTARPAGDGRVVSAAGPVVRAVDLPAPSIGEIVRVGPRRLLGEVVDLDRGRATIEVYEETAGLRVGDPVAATGAPLRAWLGPGLLGSTYDGLQRPLDRLAAAGTTVLRPGLVVPGGEAVAALGDRRWSFEPARDDGDVVGPGDRLGWVAEGPFRHAILVPPDAPAGRLTGLAGGERTVDEPIGRIDGDDGSTDLFLAHAWPVRRPRPIRRRLGIERPLLTGMRTIDMLYPVARGGTAVIPGGFGTGKTVVEQSLARWSDADVVVYVGCGERGNEMAELLDTFPGLVDPRTGGPLLARTVLVANTSNMPVAAREASVQLGITVAEYFRDQGLAVALLADSTSRWAEALREISGRLEELPGEEGYPAYLGSRLAGFYERAGRVATLGEPGAEGSVTIVGAVSPPGGDFSEPVTQASLRLAGTFWALDTDLAHARHFPAIGWDRSYSLYVEPLARWYGESVHPDWAETRARAVELLARERELLDIVQLVGIDALPDEDRAALDVARLVRETFLQQHAYDPVDASRPPDVQFALLRCVLAALDGIRASLAAGALLDAALAAPALDEARRAKTWAGEGLVARLEDLAGRLATPVAVAERLPGMAAPRAADDGAAPAGGSEEASR